MLNYDICVIMYIYIYIHIYTERDIEREREMTPRNWSKMLDGGQALELESAESPKLRGTSAKSARAQQLGLLYRGTPRPVTPSNPRRSPILTQMTMPLSPLILTGRRGTLTFNRRFPSNGSYAKKCVCDTCSSPISNICPKDEYRTLGVPHLQYLHI